MPVQPFLLFWPSKEPLKVGHQQWCAHDQSLAAADLFLEVWSKILVWFAVINLGFIAWLQEALSVSHSMQMIGLRFKLPF